MAASSGARLLTQEQVGEIFSFYSNFGRSSAMTFQESMDNVAFAKLARECPGLLDRAVNPIEVDLIFTKAKPKHERRLDFEHFLDALAAVAAKKFPDQPPADGLRLLLVHHLAPLYDIVQLEMQKTGETEVPLTGVFKKLYDVRSYTGVYAERFRSGDGRINGDADNRPGRSFNGSTNTGTDETIHDISVLFRPNLHGAGTMLSPTNHALRRRSSAKPPSERLGSPSAYAASPGRSVRGGGSPTGGARRAGGAASPSRSASRATGGAGASSSAPPAAAALGDEDARLLLEAAARARAGDSGDLLRLAEAIAHRQQAAAPPPSSSGGGGGGWDGGAASVAVAAAGPGSSRGGGGGYGGGGGSGSSAYGAPPPDVSDPAALAASHREALSGPPRLSQEQVESIFGFYANFGRSHVQTYQESIDSFMFAKFARECPGLLDRSLQQSDIDLIFTKAKPKFERRLAFTHFLDALAAIAERKYPSFSPADGLRLLLAHHLAPLYDAVQLEMQKTGETEVPLTGVFKKLYDVRSYTGVYAERFRSGDGRINGDADNRPGRSFNGSTNTGTDETIHDISVLFRPNLRSGTLQATRHVPPGGSPRAALRSASPSRAAVGGSLRSLRSPASVAPPPSVAGDARSSGGYGE